MALQPLGPSCTRELSQQARRLASTASAWRVPIVRARRARAQESLAEGCTKVDEIVESFGDVGLQDRSMVWNTDLVEVRARAGTALMYRQGPGSRGWAQQAWQHLHTGGERGSPEPARLLWSAYPRE